MQIGIVGYPRSGKSSLFRWLTGVPPDPALAHRGQSAMCPVRDPRMDDLMAVYQPKKRTDAAIELVDTPGLAHDSDKAAQRLAIIRQADCLVVVLAAFGDHDPGSAWESFRDDLVFADLDLVLRRMERVDEQLRKPRPGKEALEAERATLEKVRAHLESGKEIERGRLHPEEEKRVRSFQLFALKPRFYLFNVDDDGPTEPPVELPPGARAACVPLSLALELEEMAPEERAELCGEFGIAPPDKQALVRKLLEASGQIVFFTAGPKEVRSWLLPDGGTAVEAAGNIHTDLARGFIRAEVMRAEDVIRLGSERAVKAEGLWRQEPRDYAIREGDVVLIRHN